MTRATGRRTTSAVLAAAIAILLLPATLLAQAPGQVSNPVPANGATNVAITTALSWSPATGALRYDVRLGTTTPPPVVLRNSKETTYQPTSPLQPGTTYYWQADARGRGSSVTAGPVWSFTTAAAPDPPPSAPGSPSPANGATGVAIGASLAWAASSNTTGYDVAFGTANPPPVVSTNQPGTTYDPPGDLAHGTTYYWQVTARGPGGTTAGPIWSFTTAAAPDPPPSAPGSPSPANGATGVAINAALTWAASSNTTGYDVAFGPANPPPVVSTNQPGTTYDPPGDLAHATTYYWQVTARGPGGTTAGPVWSFTTAAAPPTTTTLDRLRVMTWNIKSGQSLTGALNIDAQVALMADAGAHVIILQEVTITTTADLSVRYEAGLEALTGQEWHSVWAPAPRQSTSTPEGNLLLTSLPILESSTLEIDSVPSDPTWLDTKRSAVRASVAVNGSIVNVIGTHLPVNASQRASHMQTLLNWLATFPAPRLVGGDFNMVQGEAPYTAMAGAFADAWPQLAFGDQGFTMDKRASAGDQPGRIDYWWQEKVSPEAGATDIWVVKTKRSDHHALIVDVEVR